MERLVFRLDEIPPDGLTFELAADPATYGIQQVEVAFPPGISGWISVRKDRGDLIVKGAVQATILLPCARCIETARCPVGSDFDFRIVPEGRGPMAEDVELRSGELEVEFYPGEAVDIGNLVAEQIYLLLPMTALCREECRGLCPVCGQNLNEKDCGHRGEALDTRWKALQDLGKKTQGGT